MRTSFGELFGRWEIVAADPAPFLSSGLRDRAWLDRSLDRRCSTPPPARRSTAIGFVTLDVRSDNLCFRDGRAVLVDWNWASFANPAVDIAGWAAEPRASKAGRPRGRCCRLRASSRALVAGVWAAVVGLPPPETAPFVREVQREQLAVALDWVDREL